jgi:hypothetical protein
MTAKTIIRQAKALLQVTTILISVGLVPVMVGLVPVMVGTLGRSLAPNHAATALDPQTDGPVFQW